MAFDIEKMNKLPAEARFFDTNVIWYFPNRWVVRWLYPLPVTPTQVTFASLLVGLISVGCYMIESDVGLMWGAIFLYGKIFLDNIDGNLARVRGETSRMGRFLDSLTDFIICFLVYLALAMRLVNETGDSWYWFLGGFALLSCLLHCSYFVFYLVNYTSVFGSYLCNRADESIKEEDSEAYESRKLSTLVYYMQWCHVFLYGWQDKAVEYSDRVSRRLAFGRNYKTLPTGDWYADKAFLTLISPLCLCTNNMAIVVFSMMGEVAQGFLFVVVLGNAYLFGLQVWKILKSRKEPVPRM